MALRNLNPPQRTRTSKYNYSTEDINAAVEAVRADGNPGDGPFKSAGLARSAAAALIAAITKAGFEDEIGSRVWEAEGEGFFFALKQGRRKYYDQSESQADDSSQPEQAPEPEPEPSSRKRK